MRHILCLAILFVPSIALAHYPYGSSVHQHLFGNQTTIRVNGKVVYENSDDDGSNQTIHVGNANGNVVVTSSQTQARSVKPNAAVSINQKIETDQQIETRTRTPSTQTFLKNVIRTFVLLFYIFCAIAVASYFIYLHLVIAKRPK